MKRLVLVVAVLVSTTFFAPSAGQTTKPLTRQVDRAAISKIAAALPSQGWQRSVWSQGSCQTGDAKPMERKVWAAVMGCEKVLTGAAVRWIHSGFHLPALTPSGTFPNVKVSASFDVTSIVGTAWLEVGVVPTGVFGTGPARTVRQVTAPGTLTVLSNAITLEAGKSYEAGAWVNVNDLGGEICGAVATITEIKWVF